MSNSPHLESSSKPLEIQLLHWSRSGQQWQWQACGCLKKKKCFSTSRVMGTTKQRASPAFRKAAGHLAPELQLRHPEQNDTLAPAN